MSQHYIFTLANDLCWQERRGTAISLFNTRRVMICTQMGALVRAGHLRLCPFNRACLQWLAIVDRGSCSASRRTEPPVSFPRFITTFPIYVYWKLLACTHMDKWTHTHIFFAHYVKYQMVKQTLSSHWGELGCLSSHAFRKFWVSGPHWQSHSSSLIITPWFTAQHQCFLSCTRLEPN